MNDLSITDVLQTICDLVYRHSGIRLGDKDLGVLRTRLDKRLRDLGLRGYSQYLSLLTGPEAEREIPALIDAVTINYTYFFREESQFNALSAHVFPALLAQKERAGSDRIRIWSAGCSSGEEPYSIAIAFNEVVGNTDWYDFQILATDINRRVLRAARRGIYPQDRFSPIPAEWHYKYLVRDAETPEKHMRICDEIRSLVTFRRFNILHDAEAMRGQLDVIFCRNVMMYFDSATQEALLVKFRDYLPRGGYLFVGESDDMTTPPAGFSCISPGVFRRG